MFCLTSVECSVSMDSVLRGRYKGKLLHRVVPLYETLPPPHRFSVVIPVSHRPIGSSTTSEGRPGSHTVVTPAVASPGPTRSAADDAVDSKFGIVTNARRFAEKRKVIQAMSGPAPEGSSGPIGRWVMQCRGLMRWLSSPSSDPTDVLVIPDDDIQQSKGIERASHQPLVPIPVSVGVNPLSPRGSP